MTNATTTWFLGDWLGGINRLIFSRSNPRASEDALTNSASPDVTESLLVQRVRIGDETAFHEIWIRHHANLVRFASRYVPSVDIALDLVQDMFLSVWTNRETFAPKSTIAAHLYKRLWHLIQHQRRRSRTEAAHFKSHIESHTVDESTRAHDSVNAAADRPDAIDLGLSVDTLLASMTPRVREIFLLSRVNGLSAPEIAAMLNISPQVVRNQISRALKILAHGISNLDVDSNER